MTITLKSPGYSKTPPEYTPPASLTQAEAAGLLGKMKSLDNSITRFDSQKQSL